MRCGIITRLKKINAFDFFKEDLTWDLIRKPSVEIKDKTAIVHIDLLGHQPIREIPLSFIVSKDGIQ